MDNTEDKAVNTILMTDALWKRGESLKIHVDRMPAAMPLRCYAVCREGKRRKVLTARISGDEGHGDGRSPTIMRLDVVRVPCADAWCHGIDAGDL